MIAFVIQDINVCGGTHKQLLKLIEYTERQGQEFLILTKYLDLNNTYIGYRRYADRIKIFKVPNCLRHRFVCSLIPLYSKFFLRYLLKDCDIVNIHDNGFEELYPCLYDKKVFWQINDLPSAFRVGVHSNCEDSSLFREQRKQILKHTKSFKAIVVNVSKNAQEVRASMKRQAYVFYCGIEPVNVIREEEERKKRFNAKCINMLTSGVFFPYRNYETQIDVVKNLKDRGYDVNLHIIGDTSRDPQYATKIQSLINEKGLHNQIIIEGQVDSNRFAYLHQHADFFVFINIDQSWGLAVFEAMSCGLPVIVSKSVGATEILNDNVDSIFVEPNNTDEIVEQIEHLASNEDYYRRISIQASAFCKEWTWEISYCSKMYNLMFC